MSQPRDADAITDAEFAAGVRAQRHDFGDHFVSGYDVGPVNRQVSLGNVQIGAAHAAGPHSDEELIRRG